MSFWDHLEELRWHLMRSFGAVVVMAIVAFLNRRIIFDEVILAPSTSEFITNRMMCRIGEFLSLDALCMDSMKLQIININMPGQFLTHMYISFGGRHYCCVSLHFVPILEFYQARFARKRSQIFRPNCQHQFLLFYAGILSAFYHCATTVNF